MRRRLVGFTLATLAAMASRETCAEEPPALIVEEVAAASAAAAVGLLAGDRIESCDGRALPSPAALLAAEENTFGKDTVALRVRREGVASTLAAPLGKLGMQVRADLPATALAPYEEGRAAQKEQKPSDAVARWTQAAGAAQDAGDLASAAWLHGRVGDIQEGQRQWKLASEAHARALALWKQTGDAAAQSRTLVALGRCSLGVNDFPAALAWYQQAEKIDAAAGHEMWMAGDLAALGGIAIDRSDLAAAQTYHSRAFDIRNRRAPGSLEAAESVHGLGAVAYNRSDLPVAQDYFRRALDIRERLAPDSLAVAGSLQSLGNVAYRRGDLAAARDLYTRALDLGERVAPDSLEVSSSLNSLGNLEVGRGDLASGESYYRRALDIRERLTPGSLPVAGFLTNLGIVWHARGDLAAAEAHFRRAHELNERLAPDSLAVANSLTNLGAIFYDRGDAVAAEGYHRRALDIGERRAPEALGVAYSLFNLGRISRDRGDLVAADDYFARGLQIRERLAPDSQGVAIALNHLGKVARDRGDLVAAQEYQDRALAIHERLAPSSPYIPVTLNDLGLLAWSRGDLSGAQDYLRRALILREQIGPDSLAVAEILNGLGGIALEQRRFDEALAFFTRGVEIVESQRWRVRAAEARALLLAQHTASYAGLLRTHLALNDVPAAFVTAERARARSLLEILNIRSAEIRQGVDLTLLERERRLQRQLNDKAVQHERLLGSPSTDKQAATARTELDALVVQYRELQAQIRAESPRYAALTQPQPIELSEIQREVLDEETLLLEYVLGEERSHLFAVTSASISSFALPERVQVEQAARRVYDALIARQPSAGETPVQRRARIEKADADYPAAAAELSRMILGPVAGLLSGQRLLIVADGALQYVPFAALPRPGQPANAHAEPLVVKHEIVSLPSASIVPVLRRERTAGPSAGRAVAVLADPVFDRQDPRLKGRGAAAVPAAASSLPADITRSARAAGLTDDRGTLARLPFTRDEADAIMALVPGGRGTRAVDFSASRQTMLSAPWGRARIVHIATHGLLDAERPELSGLVLSLVDQEGRPQDGFLRLHEVYNLDWSADLVVLSACQTALGKEIKGEGLVGLTRGFMYGGAPRVVASLWNVNDSATAQLMKRFYAGLLGQKLSPAAALRAAQVEMWRRQPARSPYFWAPFVLQGEWR
jgi:CHAT domain-containing protein/Tfp pilus assembly protein PilF